MNTTTNNKEGFIRRKLVNPLFDFLKQGVTPHKLALAVAVGIAMGVFPMLGVTTTICALLAVLFRLNMAAIQLVNYLVYPLQILLYIPYFSMGSKLWGEKNIVTSVSQIYNMLKHDTWHAVQTLWWANMHALMAWVLTAPVACLLIYFLLKFLFTKAETTLSKKKVSEVVPNK